METEALTDTLEAAGLSPYQAEAYVALLDHGTASATDIADASDVPSPRIYDVLQALEDQGYVETFEQAALKARAHSPSNVVDDLESRAERLEEAAAEVERRWEQPEVEAGEASIVRRFETVLTRAKSFIAEANHQVLLSTTVANLRDLRPAIEDAADRGVSVRVSVHTNGEQSIPDLEPFAAHCTEIRHRPLPAPFVALADRRRACFAHHAASHDRYGVLVNDRTHTYVFYWYYLTCLWEPWEQIHRTDDGYPIEYVDVRHLVRDLRAADWRDDTVRLRVEGYDTDTGEECRLEGELADIRVPFESEAATGFELAGQVTVDLDVDGERVSVGGWGAIVEDVEATRLTVVG